jgi:hypothetical protein
MANGVHFYLDPTTSTVEHAYESSSPDSRDRSRSAYLMGLLLGGRDFAKAKIYFGESLSIAKRLNDSRLISDALDGSTSVAFSEGSFNKAYSASEESLRYAIKANHPFRIALSTHNLATIARRFGMHDESLAYGIGSEAQAALNLLVRAYSGIN